jgi:hypothetical protein
MRPADRAARTRLQVKSKAAADQPASGRPLAAARHLGAGLSSVRECVVNETTASAETPSNQLDE